MSPADIAFHRFVWTGLVLLPIVLRDGLGDLGGVGWGRGLVVFLLAGPFQAIISYSGFIFAPLAHGGVIHPGSAAMFGFVLAALVLKERLTLWNLAGTLTIVAGLAVFAGELVISIGGNALGGDLLFMTAGLMWALFGMLVKLWGLDSARATRVSCFFALVIFAPLHGLLFGYGTMLSASLTENLDPDRGAGRARRRAGDVSLFPRRRHPRRRPGRDLSLAGAGPDAADRLRHVRRRADAGATRRPRGGDARILAGAAALTPACAQLTAVIPGRRESGEPGIHTPAAGVWIPGSSLRSAPE